MTPWWEKEAKSESTPLPALAGYRTRRSERDKTRYDTTRTRTNHVNKHAYRDLRRKRVRGDSDAPIHPSVGQPPLRVVVENFAT